MTKSLTVSIESVEKGEHVSITGTQNPNEFVKEVVLTVGTYKVALNSQDIAEALKVLVDFQTPPKGTSESSDIRNIDESLFKVTTFQPDYKMSTVIEPPVFSEPIPIGMTNMGWTK